MRSVFRLSVVLVAIGCGDGEAPVDPGGLDAGIDAAGQDAGGGAPGVDAAVEDSPDASAMDAGDAGASGDSGPADAGSVIDAGGDPGPADAGSAADGGVERSVLWPTFCPSMATPAGFYRGTLAHNLTEHTAVCGLTAPGRDGFVRVEVEPGQTLRAVYRHAGDGVLYLLDNCPVFSSCLDQSDRSSSGPEEVVWTNTAGATNPVYLGLDSADRDGPATFELDIYLTR